ncbi:hypothetical protein TNCV_5061861 [Trichonephila clavipes]|nr:hypothetical protein TNCV_5061861 [Trichonephila clavipes]
MKTDDRWRGGKSFETLGRQDDEEASLGERPLQILQEVFFWDGAQKPRHVPLDVRNIVNIDNSFFSSLNSG